MSFEVRLRPVPSSSLTRFVALAAFFLGVSAPIFAAGNTPAVPVPGPEAGGNARWNTNSPLQPAAILGDSTWFAGHSDPKEGNTLEYHGLDIEGGIMFTATGQGVTVHDVRSGPAQAASYMYGWRVGGNFPGWEHVGDADWFVKHIDAPAGNGSIAGVSMEAQGFGVIAAPSAAGAYVAYHSKVFTSQVLAVRSAGTDWAYALGDGGKVVRFNMSATASMDECLDVPVGHCSGVDKGQVTAVGTGWVTMGGTGNFLATGKWLAGGSIKIWSLSDPAVPTLALEFAAPARGLAMWRMGSSYYLARMDGTGKKLSIHDVSCIAGGSCTSAPEIFTTTLASPTLMPYVTASVDGGKAYLYVGGDDYGSCAPQREYIFDVTNPTSPTELTPKIHPDGYWGWYYMGCPTGFTLVGPRIGQVYGGHLYRAANSILDAHKLGGPSAPNADFSWSPSVIYPVHAGRLHRSFLGQPDDLRLGLRRWHAEWLG